MTMDWDSIKYESPEEYEERFKEKLKRHSEYTHDETE